jgi:hypothetical protein
MPIVTVTVKSGVARRVSGKTIALTRSVHYRQRRKRVCWGSFRRQLVSTEARTQPCLECGWPALAGTRRCPYCRAMLPRPSHRHSFAWHTLPLGWLAAAWFGLMFGLIAVSFVVVGWPLALAISVASLGPVAFAALLRQRTLARIRALTARRAAESGRPPAPRPPRPTDLSKN